MSATKHTRSPRPRVNDTIIDPAGHTNRVLMVRGSKLLLADSTGFQFILARHRLDNGRWYVKRPVRSQRRPLSRIPHIPRTRSITAHA